MLSVIIPTLESERALVRTLAALVPGATSGLVSEVLVADGGSHDDTAAVADVAGCNFMAVDGPPGRRLKAAAAVARAPWLLFLRPGTVLDTPWIGETLHFVEQPSPDGRGAVFRPGGHPRPDNSLLSFLLAAVSGRPHPSQGLLISKQFYEKIGGHSERAADPESDLLKRLGRRRIVTLSTRAFHA
jgi:glycosyltransferase involved in cell wall biosynthesis